MLECTLLAKSLFLTSLLQYLAKNIALLVQKFCGEFILSEFVSGYFYNKKKFFGGFPRAKSVTF